MPGRQSTAAPSAKKPKPKKQKAKRSLNALAIAEQENPERIRIRQSRLGESEPVPSKRKRGEEEESEEEGGERGKTRRAGHKDRYGNEIEAGSDSSGNEWVLGQIDSGDDSDLDSDEAMGESDDEKFEGFTFREGASATPRKKVRSKGNDVDLREDGGEDDLSDEESDGLGIDAVDLATMLDGSEDEEEETRVSKSSRASKKVSSEPDLKPDSTDDESASEDEESALSYSDNEDDTADAAKLASLQALVSSMTSDDKSTSRTRPTVDAQESTTPSEFGLNSMRKLTVADMMSSVTDPRLAKSLKLLADNESKSSKRGDIPRKLNVPLPKRQQDRLDRAAAYEKSKETLSRWIDTVKHNRRAEHLSFPLQDPNTVVAQGSQRLLPDTQSKPLTDLESTIKSILENSGLAPLNGRSEEDQLQAFEELKTNKMPLEEVQARRAELRQTRELLFREEIRAKRIKKIKSKTYRKIHRKERERLAQQEKGALVAAGVDNSESEQERNDRRRAEERMGARHRESKWAKGIKDSGRAKWDEDARSGVTEMARRVEELKKRIEGKQVDVEDGDDVSSESDYGEDDGDFEHAEERRSQRAQDRLQALGQHGNAVESGISGSRLSNMEFMKKAEAARSARNDADAERLRRDLAGEETPSEEGAEDGLGRKTYGPAKGKIGFEQRPRKEQRSEFEERLGSDSDDEDNHALDEEDTQIIVDGSQVPSKVSSVTEPSISEKKIKRGQLTNNEPIPDPSENPWLSTSKKGANVGKRRTQDSQAGAIISNTITSDQITTKAQKVKPRSALKGSRDAETAHQPAQEPRKVAQTKGSESENEDESTDGLPFVLRNQDLVRKAFAGDEVVADFEKEKLDTIQDEEAKIIDNTLPGWGNWTGAGIGKKAEKRNKGKIMTKEPGIARDKRKDAKLDRVIINEQRVKKNAKYLASNLPHPFETRQQYERSLRLPVGPEWTTKETFQAATKPSILMKQGIISPMVKPIL